MRVVVAGLRGDDGGADDRIDCRCRLLDRQPRLHLAIRDLDARRGAEGPFDPRFDPPQSTVVAGVVRGGTAVNIIPEQCAVEFEVRGIPADDPAALAAEVEAAAAGLVADGAALGCTAETLGAYPALPPAGSGLATLLERLTGRAALPSVSYGTEAGLFQAAGIPAIVCGPGEIARAHRADEYILTDELAACCAMLRNLAAHLAAGA